MWATVRGGGRREVQVRVGYGTGAGGGVAKGVHEGSQRRRFGGRCSCAWARQIKVRVRGPCCTLRTQASTAPRWPRAPYLGPPTSCPLPRAPSCPLVPPTISIVFILHAQGAEVLKLRGDVALAAGDFRSAQHLFSQVGAWVQD